MERDFTKWLKYLESIRQTQFLTLHKKLSWECNKTNSQITCQLVASAQFGTNLIDSTLQLLLHSISLPKWTLIFKAVKTKAFCDHFVLTEFIFHIDIVWPQIDFQMKYVYLNTQSIWVLSLLDRLTQYWFN